MIPSDRLMLQRLRTDTRLDWHEREVIKEAVRYIQKLEEAKDWENPYSKAISVLESHARAFEGSYG